MKKTKNHQKKMRFSKSCKEVNITEEGDFSVKLTNVEGVFTLETPEEEVISSVPVEEVITGKSVEGASPIKDLEEGIRGGSAIATSRTSPPLGRAEDF